MNLLEIFTGTREEKEAKKTRDELRERLAQRGRLSARDQGSLSQAEVMSRRAFLRKAAATTAVAVVALPSTAFIISELLKAEPEADFEEVYRAYLRDWERIAALNVKSQEYLDFFKARRRKGILHLNGEIIAAEEGGYDNFYTAIVDPRRHPRQFAELPGSFATFNGGSVPNQFTIKNIPVTGEWAGALLAKESVHLYQWMNGIEQERPEGYLDGEIDAYNLEMDLLDKITGGRFRVELSTMTNDEESTNQNGVTMRGSLTAEEAARMDALFPSVRSEAERGLRLGAYLVGVNFVMIEKHSDGSRDELNGKRTFINFVLNGAFDQPPSTQDTA